MTIDIDRVRKEEEIMPLIGMCPYLKESKKKGVTGCECATFNFPDTQAKRDVVYGCCAHPENWKSCSFKNAMDKYYYERKYKK